MTPSLTSRNNKTQCQTKARCPCEPLFCYSGTQNAAATSDRWEVQEGQRILRCNAPARACRCLESFQGHKANKKVEGPTSSECHIASLSLRRCLENPFVFSSRWKKHRKHSTSHRFGQLGELRSRKILRLFHYVFIYSEHFVERA